MKKYSNMVGKARNSPRSVEKRFFVPKLHLDPIWNRFRSNELQKMKMLYTYKWSKVGNNTKILAEKLILRDNCNAHFGNIMRKSVTLQRVVRCMYCCTIAYGTFHHDHTLE